MPAQSIASSTTIRPSPCRYALTGLDEMSHVGHLVTALATARTILARARLRTVIGASEFAPIAHVSGDGTFPRRWDGGFLIETPTHLANLVTVLSDVIRTLQQELRHAETHLD